MANLKDAFVIRPTNTEEKEFMITIGNHLATEEKFKSRATAQREYNIIVTGKQIGRAHV